MLPATEIREQQATDLLRVCCEPATHARLLAYARKLAGAEADELLQQALLDAHDSRCRRTAPAASHRRNGRPSRDKR